MSTTYLPVLVAREGVADDVVLEQFLGDLSIAFLPGPAFETPVTWEQLYAAQAHPLELHRRAFECLAKFAVDAQVVGQPPALMLSFSGWESCMLLIGEFWERLAGHVPGELVVGVPARDVVMVTGSASPPGLERVRRAVDRLFFAGGANLLSRDLLVWRHGWELFQPGH
ncbi:MAG: hypothetical protein HOV83_33350 [Catenulispora sp.]|nr:hypothetical protein [Catenulispora sp.]